MTVITKQEAATLWGNGFKLQDKEGKQYLIEGAYDHFICLYDVDGMIHDDIKSGQIGTEYFIIARPLSQLTQEIEPGSSMRISQVKLMMNTIVNSL